MGGVRCYSWGNDTNQEVEDRCHQIRTGNFGQRNREAIKMGVQQSHNGSRRRLKKEAEPRKKYDITFIGHRILEITWL